MSGLFAFASSVRISPDPSSEAMAGENLEIESLRPQEALLELIRHSYASRFGNHLFHATGLVTHFKQCARLVQNARLHRFRRSAFFISYR
jgi:hypothetical protein